MNYPYSQANRLQEPHNYMYTPFQGIELLQSYQTSRMTVVHRRIIAGYTASEMDRMLAAYALPALAKLFDASSAESGSRFRKLLESVGARITGKDNLEADVLARGLEKLTTAAPVPTLDLLHALVAAQLANVLPSETKSWLDRLVQRFEVTKKLYEFYPQGFRKGEGANTSVRLYWLFALALCLYYARTGRLKYLSSLLKVCDLLCSLPEDLLHGQIPEYGLVGVLAAELAGVQQLAEQKGIYSESD